MNITAVGNSTHGLLDTPDANRLFHALMLVTQPRLGYLCKRSAP
jgi:hypothetical protein